MPNAAGKLMSLEEFLAWERDQPERYEYAAGVITMMTGASLAHATITMNVAIALRQLCEVRVSTIRKRRKSLSGKLSPVS